MFSATNDSRSKPVSRAICVLTLTSCAYRNESRRIVPSTGSVPASAVPWPDTWVPTPWVVTFGNVQAPPPSLVSTREMRRMADASSMYAYSWV